MFQGRQELAREPFSTGCQFLSSLFLRAPQEFILALAIVVANKWIRDVSRLQTPTSPGRMTLFVHEASAPIAIFCARFGVLS
jgi:hypothetical protein